jgi:hypothetical protein
MFYKIREILRKMYQNRIVYIENNTTILTVNGKRVNPKSQEGKKILREVRKDIKDSLDAVDDSMRDIRRIFTKR